MFRSPQAAILPGFLCAIGLAAAPSDYPALPKPGEKIPFDGGHYFTYGFEQAPKMGMSIMKVDVFTSDGQKDTSYTLLGDADMPSMRGAHSTGNKPFYVSAKKSYLLPIHLAMPGGWEVRFTIQKDGKVVLRGAYLFDL